MNERLTLQDLIDILAKKQDITKKDAETFLRELIALISENIEKNEPVKIKDFGVFKLVKVNARKSVDVNTGDAIEIPAHYKLSFTPDKLLKESINRPFAHFESVILEDGVSFDNVTENEENIEEGEDSDATVEEEFVPESITPSTVISEISTLETDSILLNDEAIQEEPDTIAEKNIMESEAQSAEVENASESLEKEELTDVDEPVIVEEVLETDEPDIIEEEPSEAIDQPIEEADTRITDTPEPDDVFEDTDEELVEEVPAAPVERLAGEGFRPNIAVRSSNAKLESDQMFESHRRKTKRRKYVSLAFIVFLILAGFAVGGFYMQEIMDFITGQPPKINEKYKTKIVFEKESPIDTVAKALVVTPTDSVPSITSDAVAPAQKTPDVKTENTPKPADRPSAQTADKNKPLATETLQYGQTMRTISLKHYGHKSFWPYIYEENKNVIKNPNNIPVGTKFIIPSPAKYGIDAKNKESVDKAKALEAKIIKDLGL